MLSPASSNVPAGTYWQDHTAAATSPALVPVARLKNRPTTVVYVVNEAAALQVAESLALQCLREACEGVSADLQTLPFEKLDFGETAVLDYFYNAGKASESGELPALHALYVKLAGVYSSLSVSVSLCHHSLLA